MSKEIVFAVIIGIIAIIIVATTVSYYAFYPNVFQISGRFSVRGIDLSKSFEGSTMVTSFFLLRSLENEELSVSLEANEGWTAESLTLYNMTLQEYAVLFQANDSVSLHIWDPTFLFISVQNISISVSTGQADGAFFVAEAGGSLLLSNVTSAYVPFPSGSIVIDFQVVSGNISISDGSSSFNLDNTNHSVLIRLAARMNEPTNLVVAGRFQVESNTFSSVEVNCWSSPIDTHFTFLEGFLSYSGVSHQVSGSQNLNLTKFKGAITLLNPQPPHEITIQGNAAKIYLGENEVTAPNLLRDLVQTLTPASGFILVVVSVGLSQLIEIYKDRRKERKEKGKELLKEVKDNLFSPLLRNLENYFEPQIRLRELDEWTYLGGLVSHNENPVDLSHLEQDVNKRLLIDSESCLPALHKKIEKFTQLLKDYNEAYVMLAKTVEPLIEKAEIVAEPNFMARAGRVIGSKGYGWSL